MTIKKIEDTNEKKQIVTIEFTEKELADLHPKPLEFMEVRGLFEGYSTKELWQCLLYLIKVLK